MGRQLAFWKYEEGVYLNNAEVYEKVCGDGIVLDGLAMLPVEKILWKIKTTFTDYDQLNDHNYESVSGSFLVYENQQSVVFDCSFSMPEEELNKIIDIMLEFNCPCYDPQISERFDGV